MSKVILLTPQLNNGGGLEKSAARIADAFIARGDDVKVVSGANKQFDPMAADIILGLDRDRHQTHLRTGNGCHASFLKSRIHSEGRLKYYICLINPSHRKILSLEKEAFESPKLKKIFALSNMVKKDILDHYNVEPDKIVVIHNGVEWDEMQSDFDVWPEKKTDPRFTFLFIGNGYLRKGLKALLRAFVGIRNARLLVIGKDKQINTYKKMAETLGVSVEFLGPQKNSRAFYQQADALVLPSFYDPFANVVIEAIAMGVQAIVSKTTGASEIITHENGIVIDNLQSIDSVRSALIEATRNPKTIQSATIARNSVKHLNYPNQLNKMIKACYE
jgi:UDP-glucose:(heptosyl)LPS alpha-1,3-glucosyltransferase